MEKMKWLPICLQNVDHDVKQYYEDSHTQSFDYNEHWLNQNTLKHLLQPKPKWTVVPTTIVRYWEYNEVTNNLVPQTTVNHKHLWAIIFSDKHIYRGHK